MGATAKLLPLLLIASPVILFVLLGYLTEVHVVYRAWREAQDFSRWIDRNKYPTLGRYGAFELIDELIDKGVWIPAMYRYVAGLPPVRLLNENSWFSAGFVTVWFALVAWFFFGYLSNRHAINVALARVPVRQKQQQPHSCGHSCDGTVAVQRKIQDEQQLKNWTRVRVHTDRIALFRFTRRPGAHRRSVAVPPCRTRSTGRRPPCGTDPSPSPAARSAARPTRWAR